MAGSMKEFTDGNWKSEVLDSPIPVVVDFWAPWCKPCLNLAPTIEKMAAEYEGKVKVGKMNRDENQEIPGSLRISAIPTVLVFKDGKEVDRLVGVNAETKFKASLDKLGVSDSTGDLANSPRSQAGPIESPRSVRLWRNLARVSHPWSA